MKTRSIVVLISVLFCSQAVFAYVSPKTDKNDQADQMNPGNMSIVKKYANMKKDIVTVSDTDAGLNYIQDEILIRFKSSEDIPKDVDAIQSSNMDQSLKDLYEKYDVSGIIPVCTSNPLFDKAGEPSNITAIRDKMRNTYKLTINDDAKKAVADFSSHPLVEMVEPNYIFKIAMTPNDPYFSSSGSIQDGLQDLWGLHSIEMESAWNTAQGSGIVVAVIDTGLDANHVDIAANIWTNTGEIPGNGMDDDYNGYIDDVHGWNFVLNNNSPTDGQGHGTHVSGTIAALGNNGTGIIGVAPKAKILPLKGLNDEGSGDTYQLAQALMYAADMGVDVINNSWGGYIITSVLEDAVSYAADKGCVIVAAAGNETSNALFHYPSSYEQVISVGSMDIYYNTISPFSNFGPRVDVFAPGSKILSLLAANSVMATDDFFQQFIVGNHYIVLDGTSMASPHVAGIAALLLEKKPYLSASQIRDIMITTVQDCGYYGWDALYGFGKTKADSAVNYSNQSPDLSAYIATPHPYEDGNKHYITRGVFEINGSARGTGFDHYTLEYAPIQDEQPVGNFIYIATGNNPVKNGFMATFDATGLNNGSYLIKLTVYDINGGSTTAYREITKDDSLMPGWPQWSVVKGLPPNLQNFQTVSLYEMTTLADMDGDGSSEIILTTCQKIYAWHETGTMLSGFPVTIPGGTGSFNGAHSNIAVGDIDDDGDLEIVVVSNKEISRYGSVQECSPVYAYHHDGSIVQGFPAAPFPTDQLINIDYFYPSSNMAAPAIADIDNDGKNDIIVTYGTSNWLDSHVILFALNGDGTVKSGWPIFTSHTRSIPENSPTVADLDNDGDREIVIQNTKPIESESKTDIFITIYHHDASVKATYETSADGVRLEEKYHIQAVDLDSDGTREIMTFSVTGYPGGATRILILDHNLNIVSELENIGSDFPTFFQYDSDIAPEICKLFDWYSINMYEYDNQLISGFPKQVGNVSFVDAPLYNTLLIQHINNEAKNSLIGTYTTDFFVDGMNRRQSGICAFSPDGSIINGWKKQIGYVSSGMSISDPDVNQQFLLSAHTNYGRVYLFKGESASKQPSPFKGYMGGPQRTGEYNPTSSGGNNGDCYVNDITLNLTTDNYGSETSWDLKNQSGTTLYSGNGYSSNSNYTQTFVLDDGDYVFTIYDSYGDGLTVGNGSYNLTDGSGSVIVTGCDFGFSEATDFCVEDSGGGNTYSLSVNSGSGDGSYEAGENVTITANGAPSGQVFDKWVVNSGSPQIANIYASVTTLTMPAGDVAVTATYKDQPPQEYTLNVISGTGDGDYTAGENVTITANSAPSGQVFDHWVVNSGSPQIANANASVTTLTMPAGNVTVTATYKDDGGGGGGDYCTSSGSNTSYEWIAGVHIGSLNNTSGASGYSDFTAQTLNASGNDSISVSLTPGFSGSSYTENWKIWIDYNLDGDFEDSGEEVLSKSGSSSVSGSFTVPGSATGTTRMRVSMSYGSAPPCCGTFSYGEVEDYTINISGGAQTYTLTVASGSGDGDYEAGENVSITANGAPSGQVFDQWLVNSGNPQIANVNASVTTLTMPAGNVAVTATYKDQPPQEYTLNVISGSGDGSYEAGENVTITANGAPSGQVFDYWVVNSGSPQIANANASSTTLTMPAGNVTVTATYKDDGGGGGDYCTSSGGSISYEWIAGVHVGTLNNTSSASGYSDFTAQTLNASGNDSISVSLTPGFSGGSYTENWKIWIDYNLDGDFEDSGEEVLSKAGSSSVSGSFTVPGTATGTTRMRVSMSYGSAPPCCGTFSYGEVEDYTINISGGAQTYTLSVSNGSGDGIYEAGGNVSITASTPPSGQVFDQWAINSGSPQIANVNASVTTLTMPAENVSVTATYKDEGGNDYCTSSGNNNSYEWIAGVQIGTLNNTSGASGYTDFTSQTLNASPNDSITVSLTPGFSGSSYTEYYKIWIDYNRDGDFEDPGEEVFAGSGNSAVSGSFTVPISASSGGTCMRVSMSYGSAPSCCGTFVYGEVEDYTVIIGY